MSQENVEFVRRWWKGFNEDGFPPPELCDPQVEVRIPSEFPFTGIYHGHEGVRKWASEVFDVIQEHRVDIEDVIQAPDDETVVMALRSTGRSKEMQIDMDVPWAALWVFRAGKLLYAQGYLTMDEALEAAGLSEYVRFIYAPLDVPEQRQQAIGQRALESKPASFAIRRRPLPPIAC